jgi:hypothetical protein
MMWRIGFPKMEVVNELIRIGRKFRNNNRSLGIV